MGLPVPAALSPCLTDHLCFAYDDASELPERARAYLATGTALGQRAVVLAPRRELGLGQKIADAAALRSAATVDVLEPAGIGGNRTVDAKATLRFLDAALSSALDEGFTGLRVVAMLTQLATEPFLRRGLGSWEHVVGQWQSCRPVATACCVDRTVLGDKAVQELACLHPRVITSGPLVPFRLFFRGGQLVLEGEVDSFTAPLLAHAVRHVRAVPGERLMIDARGLGFVNHRGLTALVDGLARRTGGVTLLGAPALVHTLRESLGVGDDLLDVLPCPW